MTDQEPLTGQVIEIETEREAESGTDIRKLTEIGRQAEIEIKTEIETDTIQESERLAQETQKAAAQNSKRSVYFTVICGCDSGWILSVEQTFSFSGRL